MGQCYNRFCCHGNVDLSDDFECQGSIPIASCMILNSIDVHGGQNACGDKNPIHICYGQSAHEVS